MDPVGRPDVEVDAVPGDRSRFVERVGSLVAAGYSVRHTAPRLVLVARPSTVLWLVSSPAGTTVGPSGWPEPAGVPGFRRCLVVLDEGPGGPRPGLPAADETWLLGEFMGRGAMPQFIVEFMASREIDVVQIVGSRLAVDLLPTIRFSFPRVPVAVDLSSEDPGGRSFLRYVTARYGNLVDRYCVPDEATRDALEESSVAGSRALVMGTAGVRAPADAASLRANLYGRLLAEVVDPG